MNRDSVLPHGRPPLSSLRCEGECYAELSFPDRGCNSPREGVYKMSNRAKIVLASVFGAAAIQIVMTACGSSKSDAAASTDAGSVAGCDLAAHSWRQTLSPAQANCSGSNWTFTQRADGFWNATENGCSNATGVARYDGTTVTLLWEDGAASSDTGVYVWPLNSACQGALGEVWQTSSAPVGSTLSSTD